MDPKTFLGKFLRVSSFGGISVSQTFPVKEMEMVMREIAGNMQTMQGFSQLLSVMVSMIWCNPVLKFSCIGDATHSGIIMPGSKLQHERPKH